MTAVATLPNLWERLHELRDACVRLELAIGDAPAVGRVLLVDRLGDDAAAMAGSVEEAIAAVPGDDEVAVLAICHERLTSASHRYHEDLAAYERVADLVGLGQERGPGWRAWAESVRDAVARCGPALEAAEGAVVARLQDLAAVAPRGRMDAPARDETQRSPGGRHG